MSKKITDADIDKFLEETKQEEAEKILNKAYEDSKEYFIEALLAYLTNGKKLKK